MTATGPADGGLRDAIRRRWFVALVTFGLVVVVGLALASRASGSTATARLLHVATDGDAAAADVKPEVLSDGRNAAAIAAFLAGPGRDLWIPGADVQAVSDGSTDTVDVTVRASSAD